MNPLSMIGAFIMTFALLFYGVATITLQRFKMVSRTVLWFFLIGVLLNIAAVVCIMIAAQDITFELHEILGYSAFIVMLIDFIMVFRVFRKNGRNAIINKSLERYAKFAYGWWVVVYFTISLLVIF
ncbi:MAG: hypothetical protein HQ522_11460 [Bacteroidetes bacterium]|nr:hypothetical protein [Bacteroidota bacterium]